MTFADVMDHIAQGFEALGVLVLAVGAVWSFVVAGLAWHRSRQPSGAYSLLRGTFGGSLLLGLEILVAADLVRTIAVAPTLDNVLILGLIVLIRTFLSFSLEIEITGTVPWHRAAANGASADRQAAAKTPRPQGH